MIRSRFCLCLMYAAAAVIFAGSSVAPAYAWNRGAMLSPIRVVIEGRDRSAVVKLINPDDQTNRYKISLVSVRMDEFGRRHHVETPTAEETEVLKMIRFSPRRATLTPKAWQTIRIMVRKPADLAPGEYRAHMKVVPIAPDRVAPQDKGASEGTEKEAVGVSLNVLFSITIPVIIRHGEGSVVLTPEKPSLVRNPDQTISLETPLVRTGAHSAYFDITAFSLAGGKRQKLGALKNTSIYTPNTRVRLNIPLEQSLVPGLPGTPIELEILDKEKRKAPVSGTWQFNLN